jgi:hypothetical protein
MKEIGSSNEDCENCGEHNQKIVTICRNCETAVTYDWDDLVELKKICNDWIQKYKPSCPESLYQVEEIECSCRNLVEEICELIGYYDNHEGEI